MLLVTGITGHSGGWFARRLIEENYSGKIRCIIRETSDTAILDGSALDVEKVIGDLGDEAFLNEVMRGVDTVLHIASITWSEKIANAAIKNGVKWLILVHTTGRYSKYKSASSEYMRIEDGLLAMRDKIAVTVLRPTMIYGSARDQNMYKLIDYLYRHRFFPVFGKGSNLMQPVHARDLGNCYFDVIVHKDVTMNREYNLPGREPMEYNDILRTVSRALDRKNIMVHIPLRLSILAARMYNSVFRRHALVNVEQVMRMNEDKAFPYEDAQRDFGYRPVDFREGILEEVQEYLSHAHKPKGIAAG